MKIVQIITRNELRGAEVSAAQLSMSLAERGHDVHLVSLYRQRPGEPGLPLSHHIVHHDLGGRVQGRVEWGVLRRLRKVLNEFPPDVVQMNAFHALKYGSLASRLSRSGWISVYRNVSIASRWIRRPWQRAWGRWLLGRVDGTVSVSEASARDFRETYGLPASGVHTIRRGVPIPAQLNRAASRTKLAELLGVSPTAPLVMHVGGMTPEKNHRGLFRAFEGIAARVSEARLVVCGNGPLDGVLREEAAAHRAAERIHFLGNRPDASDLIGGADVLLLTSEIEGIPGVVLEAAAREVPTVATRVGGTFEAIEDGVTGTLVPPGAMEALAAGACALLSDPAARNEMGRRAREFVKSRHSLEAAAVEFERLFSSLAPKRHSSRAARPSAS